MFGLTGSVFGFFFYLAIVIFLLILSICLTIAPLLIWRNTNRTNRLLAVMLARQGVKKNILKRAWELGGSDFNQIFTESAAEVAKKTFVFTGEKQPKPAPPKFRFCHYCGSDALLNADTCPNCTRILPEDPVFCPKCGHEITHGPAKCPGCGKASNT
ncbi:MAG: zinc ribbon domain-containing protein [Desulfomicrobium sp.]|nr:zinc ribbon domain-containing protein [Pseudomonadota bacterium]MBV1712255.1 zinc ribbon domain-containing protein [Desulfomicrobium sp.]MBU4572892.1 zinc ribbon domain-containing protein [Pseudomonadota bacterium]MBU4594887.1 zinc ribbon domain-containing protein [Pseudomonadota bacterium]MBV1718473.1 zinc ribbon domain-containing protein [Desulfomicrobium sp.]